MFGAGEMEDCWKKHSVFVWDQFRAHLTETVMNHPKESKTVQTVIPGGLIGILQLLDVSLNKPLKTNMQNLWTLWMTEGRLIRHQGVTSNALPCPQLFQGVKKSWELIPASMIQKSFLKCCIMQLQDGWLPRWHLIGRYG